jgi:hypothetical protein
LCFRSSKHGDITATIVIEILNTPFAVLLAVFES